MTKYAMRFKSPVSSNTLLKIKPPSTIHTVVLVHEANAVSAGTKPVIMYSEGNKIAETNLGNNSKAMIKITKIVKTKNSFKLPVKAAEVGRNAISAGNSKQIAQQNKLFLSTLISIFFPSIS